MPPLVPILPVRQLCTLARRVRPARVGAREADDSPAPSYVPIGVNGGCGLSQIPSVRSAAFEKKTLLFGSFLDPARVDYFSHSLRYACSC